MSINIIIITPKKVVYNKLIDELILPTINGEIGILKNHIPLITILNIGVLKIKINKNWIIILISKGIAQIKQNKITILVSNIEEISELSEPTVFLELKENILFLKTTKTNIEKIQALENVKKAQARFNGVKFLNESLNNK